MRQAGTPVANAVDTDALLEEIRRRQELPYLPAAITRGARS
jgi:hypothetical protein